MRPWKVTEQLPDGRTKVTYQDPRETEGELLWPSHYSEERVAELERDLGPHAEAQLEQNPVPGGGGIFKLAWIKYWSPGGRIEGTVALPPLGLTIQSWDCSFKGKEDSDFVCGGLVTRAGGSFYVDIDLVWDRLGFAETLEAVTAMCKRHPRVISKLVEDKANGPAVVSMLKDLFPGFEEIDPQGGKEARANACAPLFKASRVFLPHPTLAPWVKDARSQLVRFPKGVNDDFVDFLTQALIYLYASNLLGDAMNALKGNKSADIWLGGRR